MEASDEDRHIADELRKYFDEHGFPTHQLVERPVYEAIERVLLDWVAEMNIKYPMELHTLVTGPRGGLMFKNVELIHE